MWAPELFATMLKVPRAFGTGKASIFKSRTNEKATESHLSSEIYPIFSLDSWKSVSKINLKKFWNQVLILENWNIGNVT